MFKSIPQYSNGWFFLEGFHTFPICILSHAIPRVITSLRLPSSASPFFEPITLKTSPAAHLMKLGSQVGLLCMPYVVMPDHLHVITDSACSSSETLRFING